MRLARSFSVRPRSFTAPPPPLHGSSEAIAASELRRDTVGSGCRKTGQAAMCRVNLRGGADVPEVGRPERLGAHPDQGR